MILLWAEREGMILAGTSAPFILIRVSPAMPQARAASPTTMMPTSNERPDNAHFVRSLVAQKASPDPYQHGSGRPALILDSGSLGSWFS